jgi:hypothetical protein
MRRTWRVLTMTAEAQTQSLLGRAPSATVAEVEEIVRHLNNRSLRVPSVDIVSGRRVVVVISARPSHQNYGRLSPGGGLRAPREGMADRTVPPGELLDWLVGSKSGADMADRNRYDVQITAIRRAKGRRIRLVRLQVGARGGQRFIRSIALRGGDVALMGLTKRTRYQLTCRAEPAQRRVAVAAARVACPAGKTSRHWIIPKIPEVRAAASEDENLAERQSEKAFRLPLAPLGRSPLPPKLKAIAYPLVVNKGEGTYLKAAIGFRIVAPERTGEPIARWRLVDQETGKTVRSGHTTLHQAGTNRWGGRQDVEGPLNIKSALLRCQLEDPVNER